MVSRSRISIRECRKDPAQLCQRSSKDGCWRKENCQASCAACLRFATAESKVPPFLNFFCFILALLLLTFGSFCLTHVASYRLLSFQVRKVGRRRRRRRSLRQEFCDLHRCLWRCSTWSHLVNLSVGVRDDM